MPPKTPSDPSGVLVVDKVQGPTSARIVAEARRLLGTRRIGHCGTLDPMASGVLVLVVGEATKLASVLTGADKRYLATVRFGRSTDTLDALGATTEERPVEPGWASMDRLLQALRGEEQRQTQVPPAHSAIKRDGQRAYDLARRGQPLDLPPRPIRVKELSLIRFDDHSVELSLHATKGYYVRSLARDLCNRLGVCGHLSRLRRTASGCFELSEALPWPAATAPMLMQPAQAVRRALPCATLTRQGVEMARHGKALATEHFLEPPTEGVSAWLSPAGALVALGEQRTDGYRVVRGFTAPPEE